MAKADIRDISTKPVSVTSDPPLREIHRKLGGGQAMPGSPAGSEAKPSPKRSAPPDAALGR